MSVGLACSYVSVCCCRVLVFDCYVFALCALLVCDCVCCYVCLVWACFACVDEIAACVMVRCVVWLACL